MRTSFMWIVALSVSGCDPNFAAVLHVRFSGTVAKSGGGYRLDLRSSSGAPLDGVAPTFVAFKSGQQDVSLVLRKNTLFAQAKAVEARLFAEATASRDATADALGSVQVTLRQHQIVEAKVDLEPPPTLAGSATASYAYDGDVLQAVSVALKSELINYPGSLDLWAQGEADPVWLGRLAKVAEAQVFASAELASLLVAATPVQLIITEEPADSPEPLVRSFGWVVAQGALAGDVHTQLVSVLGEAGQVAGLLALANTAVAHAGFAADAQTLGANAEVVLHAEHVFNDVAGRARAEKDLDTPGDGFVDGDLNHNGNVDFPSADETGIAEEASSSTTYTDQLEAIGGASESRGEPFGSRVLEIQGCAANIRDVAAQVFAASRDLAADPTSPTRVTTLRDTVIKLRGDPYGDGPVQTGLCLRNRMASLTEFTLLAPD